MMTAQRPSADHADTRAWVKAVFWIAVGLEWGLMGAVGLFVVLSVAFVDRPTAVELGVSRGMTGAQVLDQAGPPDRALIDAGRFLLERDEDEGCKKSAVSSAWFYSYIFQDDSMVFFDTEDRVVCVQSGGMIYFFASH